MRKWKKFIADIHGKMYEAGDRLRVSGFYARMAQFVASAGAHYYVYGDPAYPLNQYILRPPGPWPGRPSAPPGASDTRTGVEVCRIPWVDSYGSKVIRPTVGMDTECRRVAAASISPRRRAVQWVRAAPLNDAGTTAHFEDRLGDSGEASCRGPTCRPVTSMRRAGQSSAYSSRPANSARCLLQR